MPSFSEYMERTYPERRFGGFGRDSLSAEFYGRIAALLKSTDRVLDFGAGRGAQIEEEKSPYLRTLKTFKGRVAHVEGCDIDPAVLDNPHLDGAKVFDPAEPLPYDDESFDLIFANWVFEHVDDPARVASELMRVLKPGGYVCAMTPNKYGYISLASRLVGNSRHVKLLKRIQPERLDFDVFPTRYRLNTRAAVREHFAEKGDVLVYDLSGEPAYHFNNPIIHSAFRAIHRLTPRGLNAVLLIFIQKRDF